MRNTENRDTTKTDKTLQEINCRDFAFTAAAAPQVPSTIMSSSESNALRTSIQDPKLWGIHKLYKHGGKDGGKEQEEETGEDDGTLEEIGNRNEVDDVHRSKRVSTPSSSKCVIHVESSVTLSSATHVRSTGNQRSRAFSLEEQLLVYVPKRSRDLLNEVHDPSVNDALLKKEKLHSHEHYVPRCLHTETLHVDWQYVPNRHRGNLDEVRRTSGNGAPLHRSDPDLSFWSIPTMTQTCGRAYRQRREHRLRETLHDDEHPLYAPGACKIILHPYEANDDFSRSKQMQTLCASETSPRLSSSQRGNQWIPWRTTQLTQRHREALTETRDGNEGCQGSTRTTRAKIYSGLGSFSWI